MPARTRTDLFTNEHINSIFCNIEELAEIQENLKIEIKNTHYWFIFNGLGVILIEYN